MSREKRGGSDWLSWDPKGNMDALGGPVPDRDDQLFRLVTIFRPPVYNTHQARAVKDSTVVGKVDMSLTRGMNRDEAVRGANV